MSKDIAETAKARLDEAVSYWEDNYEDALDDLRNLTGDGQWDEQIKLAREAEGRPCLTINRLPQFTRQVTGDIRSLNPAINVVPADTDASKETAEIYEGLIRDIQYESDASSVYESAAESAAQCGYGYFRILAEFEHERSFNQKITIKRIHNPLSVLFDPMAREPNRSDARYCFVVDTMTKDQFAEAYPKKEASDVDDGNLSEDSQNRSEVVEVKVAEYFWIEEKPMTIGLMSDGRVIENPPAPLADVIKTRKTTTNVVKWAKISGKEVLEGPEEFPCKYIPIIAVTGEEISVGEKVITTSVIRHAKDPQRLYNYERSSQTEHLALQPKAPFIGTVKQFEGLQKFWNTANTSNRPYLPYNPDPDAPGKPERQQPPTASAGMMQQVQLAAEDMKSTTGIYDAGLGSKSNEQSGIAIQRRQLESDISTSIYSDNLSKGIWQCGRIVVDMIPRIYDTKRSLRVIGKDDSQEMVEVNGQVGTIDGIQKVNDLSAGRYDVKVNVGPNYTTKRQETAESMMDFIRVYPPAAEITADLIAENMDWPGADQFAERLRKMLPPGVVDVKSMEPEQQQQAMQAQQQAQQEGQMMKAKAEAEIGKEMAQAQEAASDAERAQLEVVQKQIELTMMSGQMDQMVNARVEQLVDAALRSAFQPQGF